jgi:hypothetical protein
MLCIFSLVPVAFVKPMFKQTLNPQTRRKPATNRAQNFAGALRQSAMT